MKHSGYLSYLKVHSGPDPGSSFCLFGLVGNFGREESLFLWFEARTGATTASDWITRNAQLSLLRDAFLNELLIAVFVDDNTGKVTAVQLGGADLPLPPRPPQPRRAPSDIAMGEQGV